MKKEIVFILNFILLSIIMFVNSEIDFLLYDYTSLAFSEFNSSNFNVIDVIPQDWLRILFYNIIYILFFFYIPYIFMYEIFKNRKLKLKLFLWYILTYIIVSSLSLNLLYLYFYIFSKII